MDFDPDAYLAQGQAGSAPPVDPNFDPDAYLRAQGAKQYDKLQAQYGDLPSQGLAAVAGVARGASLGLSDLALTKTGLVKPETLEGLKEANPITSFAGEFGGGAGLLSGAGKLAAQAGISATETLGQHVIRGGIEGAALGAGNAVSDSALGDSDLNAQKLLAYAGLGTLGGVIGGAGAKYLGSLGALFKRSEAAAPAAEAGVAAAELPASPEALAGAQPTSLTDLEARVAEQTKYGGQNLDLPGADEVKDASSRVPLQNAITPQQLDSLSSPELAQRYQAIRELPGREGEAIRNNDLLQKKELTNLTDSTIDSLSPESEPTPDAVQGGNKAIEAFTDQYQAEKEELVPIFKSLKIASVGDNVAHLPGAVEAWVNKFPELSRVFDTESGDLSLKPYSTNLPISETTYNKLGQAVDALRENPSTARELLDIRDNMGEGINTLETGKTPSQIRTLKAGLTDYIQNALDQSGNSIEVRNILKDWAVNEGKREVIEKIFGASVGTPEFSLASKIKPELIGDKIFSNTSAVNAAKSILEPEKFNEILANWLSEQRAKATSDGVFSARKFGSILKNNQDALGMAFSDNPASFQRLRDIGTIMRAIPDAPSINPSGTAKTWLRSLFGSVADNGINPLKQIKGAFGTAEEAWARKKLIDQVNADLAGKAEQASKIRAIGSALGKVSGTINSAAKEAVSSPVGRVASIGGAIKLGESAYKSETDRIRELATDPQAMMNHLENSVAGLHASAPNIAQGMSTTVAAAVQFLNSKIPQPPSQMLLSHDWKPSPAQKAQFERYYQAVNDPISVIKQVRNGTISPEQMEALQAVHPKLLQEARQAIISNLRPEKARDLPYQQKLALGKFLGEPLDANMTPQMAIANQAAFLGPQPQSQGVQRAAWRGHGQGLQKLNPSALTATRSQRELLDKE